MHLSEKYKIQIRSTNIPLFEEEDVIFSSEEQGKVMFNDASMLILKESEVQTFIPKMKTKIEIKNEDTGVNIVHIKIPRIPGYEVENDENSYRSIYFDENEVGYTEVKNDFFDEKDTLSPSDLKLYLKRIGIDKDFLLESLKKKNIEELTLLDNVIDIYGNKNDSKNKNKNKQNKKPKPN
tara:strand:+ start:21297 stop:21836 length:540 start_codon:yes stop_codon:yes gene_type:complete